jgi:hypothetical protein
MSCFHLHGSCQPVDLELQSECEMCYGVTVCVMELCCALEELCSVLFGLCCALWGLFCMLVGSYSVRYGVILCTGRVILCAVGFCLR